MNVTNLGTIIFGGWNHPERWAKGFLNINYTKYPTPAFNKECGLTDQDFVSDPPDVVRILKDFGFNGKVYRDPFGKKFSSHDSFVNNVIPNNKLPFPANTQPQRGCMANDCAEKNNWGRHVCLPGYLSFPAIQALYSIR
jgi:hypothetical protein